MTNLNPPSSDGHPRTGGQAGSSRINKLNLNGYLTLRLATSITPLQLYAKLLEEGYSPWQAQVLYESALQAYLLGSSN